MTIAPKTIVLALIVSFTAIIVWTQLTTNNTTEQKQSKSFSSGQTSNSYQTKENEGGSVTILVTPLELRFGFPARFEVAFETHSVELDFDVDTISTLTDGNGNPLGTPSWEGSPSGGHHRKGILTFTPELKNSTQIVKLSFANVADTPLREFTWEVKQ